MLAALFTLLVITAPCPAVAGPQEDADALFQEGNALRKAGKYAEALSRYEAAHRLVPSFKLDYNMGLTLEKLGKSAGAAECYARFLQTGQGKSPLKMLELAGQKLEALSRELGMVQVSCAVEGARVTVDGQAVGRTPLAGALFLEPGRHHVEVKQAGYAPFARDLELRKGQRLTVQAMLEAQAEPEPAAIPEPTMKEPVPAEQAAVKPEAEATGAAEQSAPVEVGATAGSDDAVYDQIQRRRGKTIWAWTSLGVGLACAVGSGVMYGVGASQSNAAYDSYSALADTESADTFDAHWSDVESAERLYIGGHVLAGVAVAALGVAIYQFATRPSGPETEALGQQGFRVGLAVQGHGAGVTLGGGF